MKWKIGEPDGEQVGVPSLSVLELKIRGGRSFAGLSLVMQWLHDSGLYGVIRNVALGISWTWTFLLSKTCQSVCVFELWCDNSRGEGNVQGESCEGSASMWNGEVQLHGLYWVQGLLQKWAVVMCRSSWAHAIVFFGWYVLSYTILWARLCSKQEICQAQLGQDDTGSIAKEQRNACWDWVTGSAV